MDEEEVLTTHAGESCAHLHLDFFFGSSGSLLTSDVDDATLASLTLLVLKRAGKSLVSTCDDLVDREFTGANMVVSSEVIQIVHVVNIVDFDLEVLSFLEVILHVEALNPGRRQVVHDHFSHAKPLPLGASLLIEDQQAIRPCKCV